MVFVLPHTYPQIKLSYLCISDLFENIVSYSHYTVLITFNVFFKQPVTSNF
jgi:hypothetical protein